MPFYRLYRLDGDGLHIARAEWLDAPNDEEAIALVRAQGLAANTEIWEHGRLVASVPAEAETPQ